MNFYIIRRPLSNFIFRTFRTNGRIEAKESRDNEDNRTAGTEDNGGANKKSRTCLAPDAAFEGAHNNEANDGTENSSKCVVETGSQEQSRKMKVENKGIEERRAGI